MTNTVLGKDLVLNEFLMDIYNAKLSNMVTGCILIDYQKAFDTINHPFLSFLNGIIWFE